MSEIYEWMLCRVPLLFAEALEKLVSGDATYHSQSDTMVEPLRCYPRRSEDECIDWSSSTENIWRLVRASPRPFAGTFSFLEGKQRVTIWRANPISHQGSFSAVPGQVCFALERDPVIACGDGMLRLTEVEMKGEENPAAIILKSLRNRFR
jgi:methionyl-tRNA formyltransferase